MLSRSPTQPRVGVRPRRGRPFPGGSELPGCIGVAMTAVMRVPRPGAVSIRSCPPMAARRSVILVSPVPVVTGSNPPPVSRGKASDRRHGP
jgi:hypothetical protein